jgi:glycosyltransferase involved in cell wall biosynthesis
VQVPDGAAPRKRTARHADRPRLAVDGFYGDRAYGFGRYVRELIAALDRWADDLETCVVVPRGREAWTAGLSERTRVIVRPYCTFPLWEQIVFPQVARRYDCVVAHFPYQSSALLWPTSRSVVTVHDLMFMKRSISGLGSAPALFWLVHFYRRVAFQLHGRRARAVVAVSDATRRELGGVHVDSSVVHNVCESFVSSYGRAPPAEGLGRFFLHRGHTSPHKNTRRIVEAFARVRRRTADSTLVLYGVEIERGSPVLEGLPLDGVTVLGAVSDERLASLYRGSVAVVAASLEEGFALSIIEGFGFGTAVITSSAPPMCEVAGDAALLVEPTDVGAIAGAMERLLQEPDLRPSLLRKSKLRYALFSSEGVARQLVERYRSVMGLAERDTGPAALAPRASAAGLGAPRVTRMEEGP